MNAERIKIYSFQDFKHKEYIRKMDIKKFALIHLLLDNGEKSSQFLLKEINEFNPDIINYENVSIPSLRFNDNYCQYMDYFCFIEGYFYGMEYDDNIKLNRLYLTKKHLETYYFWKEIDFETYQEILLKKCNLESKEKILQQINKVYNEWILGTKILLKHIESDSVQDFNLEYFEKNVHLLDVKKKEKILAKQYMGILPSNL